MSNFIIILLYFIVIIITFLKFGLNSIERYIRVRTKSAICKMYWLVNFRGVCFSALRGPLDGKCYSPLPRCL